MPVSQFAGLRGVGQSRGAVPGAAIAAFQTDVKDSGRNEFIHAKQRARSRPMPQDVTFIKQTSTMHRLILISLAAEDV